MFAASIREPDEVLYIVQDADHNTVSFINLARKKAVVKMTSEELENALNKCEAAVIPGMNGPLLIEMWEKLGHMAAQVMSGRGECWMIDNFGTLQSHQGRGIASDLIRTTLKDVCEDKPVYLDTSGDEDGRAWPLYERLGFKKVGKFEIDLTRFGGQGVHTHFGMLKEPAHL
ncbi:hypothetical protein N0V93_002079 [Gnomoniopsis smithogilvyi]|uniref:N-acetyltransferase domain-containing protein n=1 Tax=Gnomoniopsis smithogilvyi TaxID=1191159 RepID=A0A9W8Z756_9PEZI|nr:hypothetical protein N0V93_002079 [Gnomoniopsis smithogilvyi]